MGTQKYRNALHFVLLWLCCSYIVPVEVQQIITAPDNNNQVVQYYPPNTRFVYYADYQPYYLSDTAQRSVIRRYWPVIYLFLAIVYVPLMTKVLNKCPGAPNTPRYYMPCCSDFSSSTCASQAGCKLSGNLCLYNCYYYYYEENKCIATNQCSYTYTNGFCTG